MNLTSPSQVKAWCIEHDFHPNKVLGQNFLIDRNALEAIVDAGLGENEDLRVKNEECEKGVNVLEIGPGLGVLTEEMLKRGVKVTAVEKDPVLAARLSESLGNPPNLTVIADDALAWLARQSPNRPIPQSVNPPIPAYLPPQSSEYTRGNFCRSNAPTTTLPNMPTAIFIRYPTD